MSSVFERGAASVDVLLDRGAAEVHRAPVQEQEPVAHLDRPQADREPVDLGVVAAGARPDLDPIPLRRLRRPELGRPGDREREANPDARAGIESLQPDLLHRRGARRCREPDRDRGLDRRVGPVRDLAVDEDPRTAPCGAVRARHHAELVERDRPARDESHRARQPGPVPPALAEPLVPAAVDAQDEPVGLPWPQARRRHLERHVGVGVRADLDAVQPDPRHAPDLLEAEVPGLPVRRQGAGVEEQAIPAHAAGEQLPERLRVEDVRDPDRLPDAGVRARGPARREPAVLRGSLANCQPSTSGIVCGCAAAEVSPRQRAGRSPGPA